MKVLIIGANGMLAKPVINYLDKQGHVLRLFSRTIDRSSWPDTYEIVKGDVFQTRDLQQAISGCDAIHINLAKTDEGRAVETVVEVALKNNISLISYISGCTVSQEHRWFDMIDSKYRAEQEIINSGIPYIIFRPSWFFETLDLMVRDGKAMIIGKQPHPGRWLAADDYAQMVAEAYALPEAKNHVFYVFGPEPHRMNDLVEQYCRQVRPEVKKVKNMPVGLVRTIALLSGNKNLKMVAAMFGYFEKVKEPAIQAESDIQLSQPKTTFKQWLALRK